MYFFQKWLKDIWKFQVYTKQFFTPLLNFVNVLTAKKVEVVRGLDLCLAKISNLLKGCFKVGRISAKRNDQWKKVIKNKGWKYKMQVISTKIKDYVG